MKKLGILITVFGLFALVGVVSASTADELQPASTITYNEDLTVHGTGRFDSAYIGSTEAGVGGVTFFNGTMINNSVDDDGESTIPLTLGDDVRIDGQIFRTEIGGDNDIKLADTIKPQTTATYDLGTTTNEFNDAYFAGAVIATDLNAETLTLTGALTGTTATFTGDVANSGDINQDIADNGAVKAMVEINGDVASCLVKSWTFNDTTPTCVRAAAGTYTLTFDSSIDVDARYYSATSTITADTRVVSAAAVNNVARFYVFDEDGVAADTDIMFVVY